MRNQRFWSKILDETKKKKQKENSTIVALLLFLSGSDIRNTHNLKFYGISYHTQRRRRNGVRIITKMVIVGVDSWCTFCSFEFVPKVLMRNLCEGAQNHRKPQRRRFFYTSKFWLWLWSWDFEYVTGNFFFQIKYRRIMMVPLKKPMSWVRQKTSLNLTSSEFETELNRFFREDQTQCTDK